MAAVHILIFGEMAGFKIIPFIATRVKTKKKKNHGAMNFFFFSQSELANCMKTTDIKFMHVYENDNVAVNGMVKV